MDYSLHSATQRQASKMKVDRRVQKTRQALRDALTELIRERPYDEITVQHLTERAQVARSSFYVHFRDKDDLLLSGFNVIGVDDPTLWVTDGEGPDPVTALFRGSALQPDIAQAFLTAESNVATQHLRNLLVVGMREWLKSAGLHEQPLEMTAHALANSLYGLLTWWARNGFPSEPDEMSAFFYELALPGLAVLLGPAAERLPKPANGRGPTAP